MKCRVIAITGKIGSGKSVVSAYLTSKGHYVIDCDSVARQLATTSQVVESVRAYLGDEYIVDKQLDRTKIRQYIFGNPQLLDGYNAIFSGIVKQRLLELIQDRQLVFVEIALLRTIDIDWYQIWNVVSNDNLRISRAATRDKTSIQNIVDISNSQRDVDNATHHIDNSGTLQQLYEQIDILLADIDVQ